MASRSVSKLYGFAVCYVVITNDGTTTRRFNDYGSQASQDYYNLVTNYMGGTVEETFWSSWGETIIIRGRNVKMKG